MLEFLEILLIVGPVGFILIMLCMYYGQEYNKKDIININESVNKNVNKNINENMNLLND